MLSLTNEQAYRIARAGYGTNQMILPPIELCQFEHTSEFLIIRDSRVENAVYMAVNNKVNKTIFREVLRFELGEPHKRSGGPTIDIIHPPEFEFDTATAVHQASMEVGLIK